MTPEVGRVVQFAESDYLYGVGLLRMRVQHIDWTAPTAYEGEDWYPVQGVEIASDGREIGARQALVRGRRLRPAPRPGRS
jgi:hypothetical protein